jgi:hypothetical protein
MDRRRVWSETLPLEALADPEILAALAARDVELLAAVRPDDTTLVPRLLAQAERAGARIGLWPMIEDSEGRWASAHNAERFCRFVESLVARAEGSRALTEVAIDLEPPFGLASRILARRRPAVGSPSFPVTSLTPARRLLVRLVDRLRAQDLAVSAAVLPMVLFERGGPDGGWQRLLATPVDGVPWSRVSVMAYTTLFEGWSLGSVSRATALALLETCCHRAIQRFGASVGISLGAVGTGAFGNEPTYRDLTELREDVAVARAAGIADVTLFDLAGALRRPPAWPWIDALATNDRLTPPPSHRARALTALMDGIGRLCASSG